MHYFVYRTVCLINGKEYIGCHKTEDIDDGYLGSGKYLKRAIEKYGRESFRREVIQYCDTEEEMFSLERELVNEDYISETNTYNLRVGGSGGGGFSVEQQRENARKSNIAQRKMSERDPNWDSDRRKKISEAVKERWEKSPWVLKPHVVGEYKHNDEVRKKISEKRKGKCTGDDNPTKRLRWIHSLEEKRSTKIHKEAPLPDGWVEGAKFKFN